MGKHSPRSFLLTNLNNGNTMLMQRNDGGGAREVCASLGGTDYNTCMGEAFFNKGGCMYTCTPLTQEEAEQWHMGGHVSAPR